MPWDRVHAEAEKWEHFISEDVRGQNGCQTRVSQG
ncbi:hypothetical protein [Candidatus Mycalebacterium sp.]